MVTDRNAEAVLRRDRAIVALGLAAVVVAAAILTIDLARSHGGIAATLLQPPGHHSAGGPPGFGRLLAMWAVMQAAMMLPTAFPMLLMHARIERNQRPERSPAGRTALLALGYLLTWTACSAALAGVQVLLQSLSLLATSPASPSPWLAGGILVAAGLFQFSRLKAACLSQCRSPVTYFMLEWREGDAGALQMGLKHGVHCVGCCWALMALLLAAGVMNLLWMAAITAFVLAEKAAPKGAAIGRAGGAGLIAWGLYVLLRAGGL